jgi:hypothetical protein
MHVSCLCVQGEVNDRYEPLPGFFQLPAFIWRKLPGLGKAAVVAVGLGLVALGIALSPVIQRSKEEHARADAALSARIQKQQLERDRREQRPRFARGTPAGRDVAARKRLVGSVVASIQTDASTRAAAGQINGPILRVQCAPFPPGEGRRPADEIPSERIGVYGCLAVTSDIPATSGNRRGAVGHPYRTRINFQNGRYAFCKVRGHPGELAVRAGPRVPIPRVCGG